MTNRITEITDKEIDRVAESIWSDASGKIVDRDTFDEAFNEFVAGYGDNTSKQRTQFLPKVFDEIRRQHPQVNKGRLFTEAGGKDLKRDREHTAKTVVTTQEEFERRGAQHVDLKDVDTVPVKEKFRFRGLKNGIPVEARMVFVTIKGKRVQRFRDRRGVFVHVENK